MKFHHQDKIKHSQNENSYLEWISQSRWHFLIKVKFHNQNEMSNLGWKFKVKRQTQNWVANSLNDDKSLSPTKIWSSRWKFIKKMKFHREEEIHWEDENSSLRWKFIVRRKIHHEGENSTLERKCIIRRQVHFWDENSSLRWKWIKKMNIDHEIENENENWSLR